MLFTERKGRDQPSRRRRQGQYHCRRSARPVRQRRNGADGYRGRSGLCLQPALLHLPGPPRARGSGDLLDQSMTTTPPPPPGWPIPWSEACRPPVAVTAAAGLRFGPEGYLWIATGDAASGRLPQDLTSLGGKVLRVDPSTGAGAPANPFASSPKDLHLWPPERAGLGAPPRHRPDVWRWSTDRVWTTRSTCWLPAATTAGIRCPDTTKGSPMTDRVKFPGAIEAKWSSGSADPGRQRPAIFPGGPVSGGVWEGRLAVATLRDSKLRLFEFTPQGDLLWARSPSPSLDGAFGRLPDPDDGARWSAVCDYLERRRQGPDPQDRTPRPRSLERTPVVSIPRWTWKTGD